MEFTDEQKKIIEDLAGINYTIKQIAIYFNIPADLLYEQFNDEESEFRYHFDRGRLINNADVDTKQLQDAKSGNLTASALFKKTSRQNYINNLKHELFGI